MKFRGVPVRFPAFAFVAMCILLAACTQNRGLSPTTGAATPADGSRLTVVTTIYPLTYFTQRIAGDRAVIAGLVPPGAEAHDFEPKPSDLRAIHDADVVVYDHPEFESWMSDALKSASLETTVIQAGGGAVSGEEDPHVWQDPVKAIEMVERIRDGLINVDFAGTEDYLTNAEVLIGDLRSMASRFQATLTGCRLSTFVVSHEAFGHMAARYGLEQVGLAGLAPEAESTARQVADIVTRMKELGIDTILVEPIASRSLAETVAAEAGASLLPLHPLETLTKAESSDGENYFTIMDRNLESLKVALDCAA